MAACQDPHQAELHFECANCDRHFRPMLHRFRDSIKGHLTIFVHWHYPRSAVARRSLGQEDPHYLSRAALFYDHRRRSPVHQRHQRFRTTADRVL